MINLEKIKSASPPTFLRRPAPAPYFHPLFLIFRSPPPGKVIKVYFTPLKRGLGSKLWHLELILTFICTNSLQPVNQYSEKKLIKEWCWMIIITKYCSKTTSHFQSKFLSDVLLLAAYCRINSLKFSNNYILAFKIKTEENHDKWKIS